MSNEYQITKCLNGFGILDFELHLNFGFWHLDFKK